MAGPVENAAVYCFACGEDVTVATNRYNMYGPACEKALPIWKKLLDQHFQEANIDCSIDDVLLDDTGCCIGRMCRKCPTNLVKMEKLVTSTQEKVKDAAKKIMESIGVKHQRKRSRRGASDDDHRLSSDDAYDDDDDSLQPTSASTSHTATPNRKRRSALNLRRNPSNSESPNVTVSIIPLKLLP